ncbi:MAG: hypothetical protein QM736_12840 [Vicinamibacterales bacterium]
MASTEEYVERTQRGTSTRTEVRRLSMEERLGDALFTGLRLTRGVDVAAVNARYDTDVWSRFGIALTPFVEEGLLTYDGSTLRLTRQGMLLANEVMAVFV